MTCGFSSTDGTKDITVGMEDGEGRAPGEPGTRPSNNSRLPCRTAYLGYLGYLRYVRYVRYLRSRLRSTYCMMPPLR